MVRIPLIRRQSKPDSSHSEDGDGKGKDNRSKDVSRPSKDNKKTQPQSSEVHYRGLQPPPGRDEDGSLYVLGTDKKIPLPNKASRQAVVKLSSPLPAEKTSIDLTLPERPPESQPAETAFVARVVVPESRPEPAVAKQEPEEDVGEGISVPEASREEKAEEPPAEVAAADAAPMPESTTEAHEVAKPAEAAVAESACAPTSPPHEDQTEHPTASGANLEAGDAAAILEAIPDRIFRIGADGVHPVPRNGRKTDGGTASGTTGFGDSTDGKAKEAGESKPRLLEKTILEELKRQSDPHTRKVVETKQLQTFEFQIRGDKEIYHLEARLTPFRESEVLALVRDVTVLRQTQDALIESKNELEIHLRERNAEMMRVNKMLKTEVELREEQEDVLKKNFRRLEMLLEDTIGAITLIVERRDPHVADHQRRVSLLSCAIGQAMSLRNDQMRAIRMAAQLHDLGMIFIPAEIIRKPGKLSEAEIAVIKIHPETDYQILKRIDFPISIADIVRQHHERMNGSGYPQGLKADQILMEARILAVADVIEGMVFERPYRTAPGLEAALKEIADQKGVLYDPDVVEFCLALFREGKFKFETAPGRVPSPDHRDL